ncbi:MAG: hypothetical protein WC371_03765 [Parachlamydiales bacterium]|jgi:nucleoprotein TPR
MLEKLFRIEQQKDQQVLFWTLAGPLLLLLTLGLGVFHQVLRVDLFLVAVAGLFLCLKQKKRGLYLALALLVGLAFWRHLQIYQNQVFELGLELSIAAGLWIAYLSFEYVGHEVGGLNEKELKFQEVLFQAEEKLVKEKDFHERQQKNFKFEMERMRHLLEEKTEEAGTLQSLSDNLHKRLLEKEKELEGLLEQVNPLKTEKEQLEAELGLKKNEMRFLEALKTELEEKTKLVQEYGNRVLELKQKELLYKQLKGQFEEKQTLLHNTRKALFLAEEESEKLKRESAENNSESNPAVRELEEELGRLGEELLKLEKDNGALQELVTHLTAQMRQMENDVSAEEAIELVMQPKEEEKTDGFLAEALSEEEEDGAIEDSEEIEAEINGVTEEIPQAQTDENRDPSLDLG